AVDAARQHDGHGQPDPLRPEPGLRADDGWHRAAAAREVSGAAPLPLPVGRPLCGSVALALVAQWREPRFPKPRAGGAPDCCTKTVKVFRPGSKTGNRSTVQARRASGDGLTLAGASGLDWAPNNSAALRPQPRGRSQPGTQFGEQDTIPGLG